MFATRSNRAIFALVGASFLYGATFVVVKSALEDLEPMSFVAWRFTLGAIALGVLAVPREKTLWTHGTAAGVLLFLGYALQTAGLQSTSASNSALITGMYVVLTPLIVAILARRLPRAWVMAGAAIAFVGVVLLTGVDGLSLSGGNLLTLGCALAFAAHIVIVSHQAHLHAVVPYTAVQLAVTAALAFPAALILEGSVPLPPRDVWGALLLTGLGVSGGAYLLQVWAQTVIGASSAAVILAAEPAFGVATGWVVLGERLDLAGWLGAVLIMVAIFMVITNQRDVPSKEAEAVTPGY